MPQIPPVAATGQGASHIGPGPKRDFGPSGAAQLAIVHGQPLYIRPAGEGDFGTIAGMISDAQERLKDLGTDQWSTDTPDKAGRKRTDRVQHSIREGKTWLATLPLLRKSAPEAIPAATVTIEQTANPWVWPDPEITAEPTVYLSRLVTAKGVSGLHVGAAIIRWAGEHGKNKYGAKWIRIDVWTTNVALHRYYEKRGFRRCGMVPDETYPARVRFQRPTSYRNTDGPRVIESVVQTPITGPATGQVVNRQIETTGRIS